VRDPCNRDRLDYSEALTSSWKEQTLLNIVKLRYADTPVFLEVSSVISSYQLQSQLSLLGTLSRNLTPNLPDTTGRGATLGATGTYTDRPTITYTPCRAINSPANYCVRFRRPPFQGRIHIPAAAHLARPDRGGAAGTGDHGSRELNHGKRAVRQPHYSAAMERCLPDANGSDCVAVVVSSSANSVPWHRHGFITQR